MSGAGRARGIDRMTHAKQSYPLISGYKTIRGTIRPESALYKGKARGRLYANNRRNAVSVEIPVRKVVNFVRSGGVYLCCGC